MHFIITNPTPNINSKHAINTLLYHWITKFGPLQYLVTDRGTEYINPEMVHLCSLIHIKHSPRTPYSPWSNGLVENQNCNLGPLLHLFLLDPPNNWSIHTQMYACAHNATPLSTLKLSLHQIVFHIHPRIHLCFDLNLTPNSQQNCTSTLPAHSLYQSTDLNPFISTLLSKPISIWTS